MRGVFKVRDGVGGSTPKWVTREREREIVWLQRAVMWLQESVAWRV